MLSHPVSIIALLTLAGSLILAIMGLRPPRSQAKKGQKESVFYHHYIAAKDQDDYDREIHEALNDENKIYEAYIREVYNLTKYSNIPRKVYVSLSMRVLIYGVLFSVVAYISTLF